ncbi:MAG: polymer-forming cytoskeletal protein [Anaerolineae bacterium]
MSTGYRPRDISLVSEAQDDETLASESLIDRHSHFNGLYRTSHDLRVEGSAEGEIECDGTLTVAPEANIDAKVRARNVVISGAATGEIMCEDRFTLRPSGQMRGQVLAASLVVEEGAFFEGEFQMSDGGAPREAPRTAAASDNVTAPRANWTHSSKAEINGTASYHGAVTDSAAEHEDVLSSSLTDGAEETDDAFTDE